MKKSLPLYLILFLALTLRLISLNQSFWLDETAQAVVSTHRLSQVNWGTDFQPPLFYTISHYWMKFGITSEWFLRIPSVIFAVLTIYLAYTFFKQLFDKKTGLLTAFLLTTSPFHIYFSQEFRMYSLLTFLTLLAWMMLYKKKWKIFTIITTIAIFTHYFAFVNLVSQVLYVILFDRKSVQKNFIHLGLAVSPFIIWLPIFMQQLETAQRLVSIWPRWKEVSSIAFLKFPGVTLAKFTVGMISPDNRFFYAGVVGLTGLIFLFSLIRLFEFKKVKNGNIIKKIRNTLYLIPNTENRKIFFLLSYFFFPLALTWIGGLWIAASTPWRIQFVLPAFYGILVVGLLSNKTGPAMASFPAGARLPWPAALRREALPAMPPILLITALSLNILFSFSYLLNPNYHRENWRDTVFYTDQKVRNGAIVLSEFNTPFVPMVWYSKEIDHYFGASTSQNITQMSVEEKLNPLIKTSNHIILYTYLFEISDPERHVEKFLEAKKFKIISEKDFRGVGIIKEMSIEK